MENSGDITNKGKEKDSEESSIGKTSDESGDEGAEQLEKASPKDKTSPDTQAKKEAETKPAEAKAVNEKAEPQATSPVESKNDARWFLSLTCRWDDGSSDASNESSQ